MQHLADQSEELGNLLNHNKTEESEPSPLPCLEAFKRLVTSPVPDIFFVFATKVLGAWKSMKAELARVSDQALPEAFMSQKDVKISSIEESKMLVLRRTIGDHVAAKLHNTARRMLFCCAPCSL